MIIAERVYQQMSGSSLIRKMFEEGERLKKIYGADRVFDFSLGNPINEPPARFGEMLRELAEHPVPGMHRYMSNAGYMETRNAVAEILASASGQKVTGDHVVMTVGASGALNVTLKTLLDPGDEVILLSPFFVEYKFYIENHGGIPRVVETGPDFLPDFAAIRQAVSARTRAIIINSPNNPTGVVYGPEILEGLSEVVDEAWRTHGREVFVISDEPYARITYDGIKVPPVFKYIKNSIVVTSHSKDLALPGERIGYAAANPAIDGVDTVVSGMIFANRILGFVNAPALMQRLVAGLQTASVDVADYEAKRNLLYDNLTAMGYRMVKPQGAFYLFPESLIPDDMEFAQKALEKNLLVVPGTSFGRPGYFRLAFCVERAMIERSLPVFEELARELA